MTIWDVGRCVAWTALVALLANAPAGGAVTLTIAGSSTLLPLVAEAAHSYENQHRGVMLVVSGGGSRAAVAQVVSKQIDMAVTDIPAADNAELVDHRIAVIAFAIAVSPRAGVTSLTRAQIAGIFSGRTTNWKEVGGDDLPIVVVNRPPGSGVRELLAKRVMGTARFASSPLEVEATSAMVGDLKGTPGSIGYASLSGLRDTGLVLEALDGVAPSDENIESGTYPLWTYEHVITYGPPTPNESRFLAFLETNRTLLHKYGYIAIGEMKVSPPGD